MLRLRQVAVVVADRDAAADDVSATFGLVAAFDDPHVARLGLENRVLPVGAEMIEVMSPISGGTTYGRYLERRRGDGGYMAILQTDDLASVDRRIDELGVRVGRYDHRGFRNRQLHPRDTGGTFLEIDEQDDGIDVAGAWRPAGPTWTEAIRTSSVVGMTAVEIQAGEPEALADRSAAVLAVEPVAGSVGIHLPLVGASIRVVPLLDDRGDGPRRRRPHVRRRRRHPCPRRGAWARLGPGTRRHRRHALVPAVTAEFDGRVANNAGIGSFGTSPNLSLERWERVFAVDVHAVFYGCRAAIPHLTRPGGAIAHAGPPRGVAAVDPDGTARPGAGDRRGDRVPRIGCGGPTSTGPSCRWTGG